MPADVCGLLGDVVGVWRCDAHGFGCSFPGWWVSAGPGPAGLVSGRRSRREPPPAALGAASAESTLSKADIVRALLDMTDDKTGARHAGPHLDRNDTMSETGPERREELLGSRRRDGATLPVRGAARSARP
ncbi:MAG TPA: hypothetical protein VEF72_05125 [Mycobacterium sp.]|nr:hypothetical protein [Mycobacterium sp.]